MMIYDDNMICIFLFPEGTLFVKVKLTVRCEKKTKNTISGRFSEDSPFDDPLSIVGLP